MNSNILVSTYKKINKFWTVPYLLSLLGLVVVSPLSFYLYELLFYGKFILEGGLSISKIVCVIGGMGSGWKLGDYLIESKLDINQLMLRDDIWVILNENIDVPKINNHTDLNILDTFYNNSDYSDFYQLVHIIFIERFNHLHMTKFENIKEIEYITHLLSIKHPFYPHHINLNVLKQEVKICLMKDLSSYIMFYYSLKNYESNRNIYITYNKINILQAIKTYYKTDIDQKYDIIDLIDIIDNSSIIFRKLPLYQDMYSKIDICKKTIKTIETRFFSIYKKPICCEDILPILTLVLIFSYDIFFITDIHLIYEYFRDNSNMEGYISTLMMSALDMFMQFTLKFQSQSINTFFKPLQIKTI